MQKFCFLRFPEEMEVFWGPGGTRDIPGAPLEALLERDVDFGRFLGAFGEALGDPLAPFGTPGDPTLAIFRPRGRHFAAPGRHPRHHAVRALQNQRKIVRN